MLSDNILPDQKIMRYHHLCYFRYDSDILIGYEVQMSSWGYLVERAAALNINLTGQLSRIPGDH